MFIYLNDSILPLVKFGAAPLVRYIKFVYKHEAVKFCITSTVWDIHVLN